MGTLKEDLTKIDSLEDKVVKNQVARFAYTKEAYDKDIVDGVEEYDVNKEQNIPIGSASVMKVNETVLNRGYRAQASSITRMLMNHFLGRLSYNLNKVNDVVSSFIKTVKNHLGSANGIATLDETGRIPYSQLPESTMEFMGTWDASTNTPTLTDGTGRNGNFYVVSVAGTQTFGGVAISFNVNDRIIYNGVTASWTKLSSGDVRTVNSIKPDATGNITLDATDVNAVKTINNRSPQEGTGNINLESLSINGQFFNGSAPVSVDTMKMIYGGTGATSAKGAEFNITEGMKSQTSDFTDTTKITCVQESPSVSTGRFFYSSASYLWNYIKGKISSVLGLTASNYGGTALNATNATNATTATNANKIVPKYIKSADLTRVTSSTIKYIKLADCLWEQTGTLQVYLNGDSFRDTFVINFGGSNSFHPMLCGYCSTHVGLVKSVIAQKGSNYDSNYSIYIKIVQRTTCTVKVALLKGDCTLSISESTTAPTDISEWAVSDGFFGNLKGNVTGISAKSSFLDEYAGAGATRITSLNIVPKDASEYGGMRKDVITDSALGGDDHPGENGHLLTMFWDNDGRYDSQFFVSNENPPTVKVRGKPNGTDYGAWTDIITSNNIGSQTVKNATTASKVQNALTINGQYYDGSSALNISIQEGAYDHIVHDDASLLEWANCTDGSMKKVLVKSGTYNMTKGVNLTNAGTGYVLAEQGAVINSHVPIAFEKTNNALCSIYNLEVVCYVSENSSYCTAFKDSYSSHVFKTYLVLYNCKAGYNTVKLCNNYLFLSCWCFNCIFDAVSNTTTGMSVKIFSSCYCTNCVCTLSIQGTTIFEESDFFSNCTCINCRGDTEINVDILHSTDAFCAFHYCYCIVCKAVFTCTTPSLSVQSPCYCFNGGSHMSGCYAFADYQSTSTRHISGICDCAYISATDSNKWEGLNSKVDADSCDNS